MNRGKKLRAGMVLLLLIFCFAMPAQAAFSKKAPSGLKAKKKDTSVTISWTGRKRCV